MNLFTGEGVKGMSFEEFASVAIVLLFFLLVLISVIVGVIVTRKDVISNSNKMEHIAKSGEDSLRKIS